MKMEEIPVFLAPSSEMMRVSMSLFSSPSRRKPISTVRKNIAVLKRAMSKKNAGWSSKDWNSKANRQRSAVEDAGQSSQDKWKSSKPRAKWKDISHNVEELGVLVKEKKSTWTVQKEKPKYTLFGKVWLKTRKLMTVPDPEESLEATAQRQGRGKRGRRTPEEMQYNVDEVQERACEAEQSLCRELEEFMY